jgi:hypothetical protein
MHSLTGVPGPVAPFIERAFGPHPTQMSQCHAYIEHARPRPHSHTAPASGNAMHSHTDVPGRVAPFTERAFGPHQTQMSQCHAYIEQTRTCSHSHTAHGSGNTQHSPNGVIRRLRLLLIKFCCTPDFPSILAPRRRYVSYRSAHALGTCACTPGLVLSHR